MITSFVDKILKLGEVQFKDAHGVLFADKEMRLLSPPSPKALRFGNLTSLVDYVKSDLDGTDRKMALLIEHPGLVLLLGGIDPAYKSRPTWATTECDIFKFPWGNWGDVESFIIGLQTHFVVDDNIKAVLGLVGNISDSNVKNFNDDGTTQQVTAKVGITKMENVKVPNPVILAPYRTFREVTQVASPFLLRMRSAQNQGGLPQCALFEADGGAWKLEAVARVKKYLAEQLPTIEVFA